MIEVRYGNHPEREGEYSKEMFATRKEARAWIRRSLFPGVRWWMFTAPRYLTEGIA